MADKYRTFIGNTFRTVITITDVDGTAVDLTGATVVMLIKDRNGDTLHTESVTSHSDPTAGETTIVITSTETAALVTGCFDYTAVATLASGEVWTAQKDQIEFTEI